MSTKTQIDLSKLKAPNIVAVPSSNEIYIEILEQLKEQAPELNALTESDPAAKILQAASYCCERMLRAVNYAGTQVMLAFASNANLDHLGALLGVKRFLLIKGDKEAIPPTDDIYESDTDYRARIQQAPESFTTAGSRGAYEFHARAAHPDIDNINVCSKEAGIVSVTVLSKKDKGIPSGDIIDAVQEKLSAEDVRPLTDCVQVEPAKIIEYKVQAKAFLKSGPDPRVVIDSAKKELKNYLESHFKLGSSIALSRIYGAFASDNIERVSVEEPQQDLVLEPNQAARCIGINVTWEVI